MYSAEAFWLSLEARELIRRHLPSITANQWRELTPKQRKAFYDILRQKAVIATTSSYEFALTALEALMQIGDAEAIPTVEHIAKHGLTDPVRNCTIECLSYLKIRRDEDSIRQTLLRASQANSSAKDKLLRVPTQTPDMQSEQLLRIP